MANFGLLAAEIDPVVWGTLNRERHLCSAARPLRWALAHILVTFYIYSTMYALVCNKQFKVHTKA